MKNRPSSISRLRFQNIKGDSFAQHSIFSINHDHPNTFAKNFVKLVLSYRIFYFEPHFPDFWDKFPRPRVFIDKWEKMINSFRKIFSSVFSEVATTVSDYWCDPLPPWTIFLMWCQNSVEIIVMASLRTLYGKFSINIIPFQIAPDKKNSDI